MSMLTVPPEVVLPSLRGAEKCLSRDPVKAEAYQIEMVKLEKASCVQLFLHL